MKLLLDPIVRDVLDKYNGARDAKESLGLNAEWREYEDYCRNKQNNPETDEDPGSVTNVIFPVIASQVSDLVDEPLAISCIGEEPSDQVFSQDLEHILDWIEFKNRMFLKLDKFENRRLKFGTSGWKIYYDPLTHMIVIEPISPVNFFPDPKVKECWQLEEGDFVAHAIHQPIPYLRRKWGSVASGLESSHQDEELTIFEGETNEDTRQITANKARVVEIWTKDKNNTLRRRVVANEKLLYDSKSDGSSFYEHGRYPFVIIPCYSVEGRLWGMGEVELLKPTQDLINDLDDQIRMNARLMGNIQIVVGLSSGINIRKWTNKAGLKIPARDHDAWRMVQPPQIPEYILRRRVEAMREAEVISGRPDVTEGRRSGVRAASAIMALQEAGSRRARHKKMFLQDSLSRVFDFCIDYLKEFYTEEQAFRILGKSMGPDNPEPQYLWFKGSKLREVPKLIPDGIGGLVPLLGEGGQEETKDAKFDVRVSVGAGLPHNQAFLYQAVIEMVKENIITREEARYFIKDQLDWPVANPGQPEGTNFGAGLIPGLGGAAPGMGLDASQFDVNSVPPQILQSLVASMGGMGGAR